jgi:hypothetical protein
MPPVQALAALHAFWVLMAVPFAVWAVRTWSAHRLLAVGRSVTLLGLLSLALYLAWDAAHWLNGFPAEYRHFVGHRILFALVNLVDVPLLAVTGAGAVGWLVGRRRTNCARSDGDVGSSD